MQHRSRSRDMSRDRSRSRNRISQSSSRLSYGKINYFEPKNDLLGELIDLQLANGTFKYGKCLETLMNMPEDSLNNTCPPGLELDFWITAICIVIIETRFDQDKDLWVLVAEKAKKYLIRNQRRNCTDEILEEARKIVNQYTV